MDWLAYTLRILEAAQSKHILNFSASAMEFLAILNSYQIHLCDARKYKRDLQPAPVAKYKHQRILVSNCLEAALNSI